MRSTKLDTILTRMNAWQDISMIEEQYKVQWLDAALRELRRDFQLPWSLQKSSLRVFDGVYEYPVDSAHDELAYIDDSTKYTYGSRSRFLYTSLKQFYEDPTNRNTIAEIFDNGTRFLGVRYKNISTGSKLLNNATVASDFTPTEDATAVALDSVFYKNSPSSIRVTVVNSSDMAVITNTFTSFSDSLYKTKYHFKWVYLSAVPTSIDMRLQTDDSNYLTANITTQFSGQAFKAGEWNLIAYDLNTATEVGTFDSSDIASEALILNGADSGFYYIDQSHLRRWTLMDYWFYSIYNIKTENASVADREYFMDEDASYDIASSLVGDSEWADVIMYDAMLNAFNDSENKLVLREIKEKRNRAWQVMENNYPSLKPIIITSKYRFNNDPGSLETFGVHSRNKC